ncbi:hypothetical protein FSP39_005403 [Pinctada imbricata]|uniref:Uncharacterized protein n=1 Tax=Pinctada imbricata TaxID=66713 RepID=A0AA89CBJ9_PINIB|nr:hypothetical protein FSP39_005403 [Pinctada imbricata]
MATAVDKKEDLTTCSICFETFKKPKHFPCLHSFCEGCIQTYITKTFEQARGGVNCPLCRMFISKPCDITVEKWSTKLPINHILVSLIDLNETKSGKKLCAACSRENETESAFSWCVHCSEALCKVCDRSHRRSKASSNHKLIELGEDTSKDIPLYHADVYCTEHSEEKVKAYCNDHSIVCCMTCVMLKHRKCDNVGSIEDAAEEKKKSNEIKEFHQNLQDLKASLEKLCKNRTENLRTFESDIKR